VAPGDDPAMSDEPQSRLFEDDPNLPPAPAPTDLPPLNRSLRCR
jgi:hypothetical protein